MSFLFLFQLGIYIYKFGPAFLILPPPPLNVGVTGLCQLPWLTHRHLISSSLSPSPHSLCDLALVFPQQPLSLAPKDVLFLIPGEYKCPFPSLLGGQLRQVDIFQINFSKNLGNNCRKYKCVSSIQFNVYGESLFSVSVWVTVINGTQFQQWGSLLSKEEAGKEQDCLHSREIRATARLPEQLDGCAVCTGLGREALAKGDLLHCVRRLRSRQWDFLDPDDGGFLFV